MSFLNPFFLWILPAASIPVLLHLLNKRPPKRLLFSHISWLREAHKVTMPKKKLQEMLLMIIRTLLVLLLICFFARPIVHTGGFLTGSGSNESLVVLLDTSASMSAVEGGRESLEWTKERLQTVLRKIPVGVKIGLVIYSDQVEQELSPTDERSRITTAIQNAKGTSRGTNVLPALKLGVGMLANQPNGRKTLVIASDLARHGWLEALEKTGALENLESETRIVLWDAVGKISNAGVSDGSLSLSEEGVLKGIARFHASENLSTDPSWSLKLNERVVSQGRWKANADAGSPIPLTAQLPEGGYYSGQIEFSPDSAPFDDAYYLAGRVPKGFRLLIVDGESGLAPSDSETYYMRSALESPRDPRIESIDVVRPEVLSNTSFTPYDVVVLANVGKLGEGGLKDTELISWVENGGGLLLTAGSKWPKPPNVPLHLFRSRASTEKPVQVLPPDLNEAFFAGISGLSEFEWEQVSVTDYVALEKENASTALLSLKNGDPLIVRKQVGKGFVMALTTSLDRAWTNFPAKPVYAPLMREIISGLADPLREQTALQGVVGVPIRLRVPSGVKSVSVVAPNGVASGAHIDKDGMMDWPAPVLPGLYLVKTDRHETDFTFAVNIPHLDQEGDLSRLGDKEAKKVFPNVRVDYVSSGADKAQALLNALEGRDMTNPLLASLFLLFALETLLGFSRKKVPALALLALMVSFGSLPVDAGSGNNFVYAQLKYDGNWDPYPTVHERILQMVRGLTNIPFTPERKVVTLDNPALFETPFLLIKGSAEFQPSSAQKTHLKEYIDRGGFVFVDDTLGDPKGPFANSIRRLMGELYPDRTFQKLPLDHALFRAFFLLRNVAGRRISEKYLEGLDVSASLDKDAVSGEGRTAVIYCPNDLFGAWVKDNLGRYSFSCEPGGETQRWESFKLTINVIYFSLTGTYKKDAIHQPFLEMKLGS